MQSWRFLHSSIERLGANACETSAYRVYEKALFKTEMLLMPHSAKPMKRPLVNQVKARYDLSVVEVHIGVNVT